MDNDDFRRGKPTNHKIYGSAMAILAGDGLLNFAFEHMLQHAYESNDVKYTHAVFEIARSAGIFGMIGGQVVDMESTGREIDAAALKYMHDSKTGALIISAVNAGGIICGADSADMKRLIQYSHDLGLAFQIIDDILDVTGDEKKLGKKVGSDACNKKNTYVSMYGLEESRRMAKSLTDTALEIVDYYGQSSLFLRQLTMFLLSRDY
jgi:geranylgeranyl diphosphate synthase type II